MNSLKGTKVETSKGTLVEVAICPLCKSGIYSVSRHDFHYCPCGSCFVDGGFDYTRVGFPPGYGRIRVVPLIVPQIKEVLINDYKYGLDITGRRYGTLSWESVKELYKKQNMKDIRIRRAGRPKLNG